MERDAQARPRRVAVPAHSFATMLAERRRMTNETRRRRNNEWVCRRRFQTNPLRKDGIGDKRSSCSLRSTSIRRPTEVKTVHRLRISSRSLLFFLVPLDVLSLGLRVTEICWMHHSSDGPAAGCIAHGDRLIQFDGLFSHIAALSLVLRFLSIQSHASHLQRHSSLPATGDWCGG